MMERMLPKQKAIIVRGKLTMLRLILVSHKCFLYDVVEMIQLLCTSVPISKFKNQSIYLLSL